MASQKGMLLVVSGPAGVGKGTLVKRLLEEDGSFGFSVSVTTRAPRPGEVDGVHYHFVTEEAYDELLAQDAFLEHAQVHSHRYGTLKSEVFSRMERGESVVLDIDVQGALNVMARFEDCVSVFILPGSFRELRARLEGRGTEQPEEVERRMRNARREVLEQPRYRYTLVNRTGEADAAYASLKAIVQAEKLRSTRFFPEVPED